MSHDRPFECGYRGERSAVPRHDHDVSSGCGPKRLRTDGGRTPTRGDDPDRKPESTSENGDDLGVARPLRTDPYFPSFPKFVVSGSELESEDILSPDEVEAATATHDVGETPLDAVIAGETSGDEALQRLVAWFGRLDEWGIDVECATLERVTANKDILVLRHPAEKRPQKSRADYEYRIRTVAVRGDSDAVTDDSDTANNVEDSSKRASGVGQGDPLGGFGAASGDGGFVREFQLQFTVAELTGGLVTYRQSGSRFVGFTGAAVTLAKIVRANTPR